MVRTAWPSVGCAVAATALVLAVPRTAPAQSPAGQAQEPSLPAKPSAADETPTRPLTLFDNRAAPNTASRSKLESWLSGADIKCFGCRGFDTSTARPESTNANAPWVLQAKWRRTTPLGLFSTGIVGVRNYASPLYNATPIGGDVDPIALGSARTSSFVPSSQWSLTASTEKTLIKRASGATIGVVADALIPLSTTSATTSDPRVGSMTSRAIRLGIIFRW